MNDSGPQQYTYDYPRPMVTVDLVIVTRDTPRKVLLIRRKGEPFVGKWALPGGFVNMDESLEDAARRELLEETGVKAGKVHQLHAFGDPGRDPRGRVITITYVAQVNEKKVTPKAADDAADVGWFPLKKLPELAFDHAEILQLARKRLKQKAV